MLSLFLQCSVLPLDGPSSTGIVVCCYRRMDLTYHLKLGSDGIKGPESLFWLRNFTIINTRSGLHSGFRTDFKFNICDLILELLQPASSFLECPLEIVSAFVRCSPNVWSILALIRSCGLFKTECLCVLPSPCGVYVSWCDTPQGSCPYSENVY